MDRCSCGNFVCPCCGSCKIIEDENNSYHPHCCISCNARFDEKGNYFEPIFDEE